MPGDFQSNNSSFQSILLLIFIVVCYVAQVTVILCLNSSASIEIQYHDSTGTGDQFDQFSMTVGLAVFDQIELGTEYTIDFLQQEYSEHFPPFQVSDSIPCSFADLHNLPYDCFTGSGNTLMSCKVRFESDDDINTSLVLKCNTAGVITGPNSAMFAVTLSAGSDRFFETSSPFSSYGVHVINPNIDNPPDAANIHEILVNIHETSPITVTFYLNDFDASDPQWQGGEVPQLIPIIQQVYAEEGHVAPKLQPIYRSDAVFFLECEANTVYVFSIKYSFRNLRLQRDTNNVSMPPSWQHNWNVRWNEQIVTTPTFSSSTQLIDVDTDINLSYLTYLHPDSGEITSEPRNWFRAQLSLSSLGSPSPQQTLVPNDLIILTFPGFYGILTPQCDISYQFSSSLNHKIASLNPQLLDELFLAAAIPSELPQLGPITNQIHTLVIDCRLSIVDSHSKFDFAHLAALDLQRLSRPQLQIFHRPDGLVNRGPLEHLEMLQTTLKPEQANPHFFIAALPTVPTRMPVVVIMVSAPATAINESTITISRGATTSRNVLITQCYYSNGGASPIPWTSAQQIGQRIADGSNQYYSMTLQDIDDYAIIECGIIALEPGPIRTTLDVTFAPNGNDSPVSYKNVGIIHTFTNYRHPMTDTKPTPAVIDLSIHGNRVGLTHEFEFSTGFYGLANDHIIIQSTLFDIFDSGFCDVSSSHGNVYQHCFFTRARAYTDHYHPNLGTHVACNIPYAQQASPIRSPFDQITTSSEFYYFPNPVTISVKCDFPFLEDLPQIDEHDHILSVIFVPDQSGFPTYTQYEALSDRTTNTPPPLFPIARTDYHYQQKITLENSPSWKCYIGASPDDVDDVIPVDCSSGINSCPKLGLGCGDHCYYHSKCFVDDEEPSSETTCEQRGLQKPHASPIFRRLDAECPSCQDSQFQYGPNCSEHPQFSRPVISAVNDLDIQAVPFKSQRDDMDGSQYTPTVTFYSLRLFYNDVITLVWSYRGPTSAKINIYLKSPSLAPLESILIATMPASRQRYRFTLETRRMLLGLSIPLQDVQFDLSMGQYRSTPDYNGFTTVVIPSVLSQCEAPIPFTLSSINNNHNLHPVFTQSQTFSALQRSSSRCKVETAVCNTETGQCECGDDYTGTSCPGDYIYEYPNQDEWSDGDIDNMYRPGDDPDENNDPQSDYSLCRLLGCVYENTFAYNNHQHPCTIPDDQHPLKARCNCRSDEFQGDQCQHQAICPLRSCVYGRLVSPSGDPQNCECQCGSEFIGGATCNQCTLPCKNGGVANTRCTECTCKTGYIGTYCTIPVWYHSYTLRNLPQSLVQLIIDASLPETPAVTHMQLAVLRKTLTRLLLDDYSRGLSQSFIINDDQTDQGENPAPGNDHRIRVNVELVDFQTIIPQQASSQPYVVIKLMLYPTNMSDEMMDYAQQHGLNLDWSRITNHLDFFTSFLKEQGIINDDNTITPVIEDPNCLSRECHDTIDDDSDPSSNHSQPSVGQISAIFISTAVSVLLLITCSWSSFI